MLPVARQEGIHVEHLPEEVIAYDIVRHKAHCLSSITASVWRMCDGQNTAEDIAAQLQKEGIKADDEMVWMVLHRLSKIDLLQERITLPKDAILSSRRELIKKAAALGGVLFLLTSTISAPIPAQASSGGHGHGHENEHHHHHERERYPEHERGAAGAVHVQRNG
jgi:hypothetical protein